MVFLQNNFVVNGEKVSRELDKLPQLAAAFSAKVLAGGKVKELKDLSGVDLGTVSQLEISEYLFMFDPTFLKFLTPLNFAFYNKFLIEEMLIFPIAALLQKS